VRVVFLFALAAACGGGGPLVGHAIPPVDAGGTPPGPCNVLAQTGCGVGEKCTWIVDATTPTYVGHIGCVPTGVQGVGAPCELGAAGATGYDNCAKGSICSAYRKPSTVGVCESICDPQGGIPTCDDSHACVSYPDLFLARATAPPVAGVCAAACDPLDDNDFDGSGSAFSRTGSACGSADTGCYGAPSRGTAPKTTFTCMRELNPGTPLVHRTECTTTTGCADVDGLVYINSCNEGYEPLLHESTATSTLVCVAMCHPLDCFAGNCGSGDANRQGAAPHRCASTDALGAFGSDEECQYLWASEIDGSGHWLPSAYSDVVGICVDHTPYGLPSCATLPLHGSGSGYDAVSLGCVSSQTAGLP